MKYFFRKIDSKNKLRYNLCDKYTNGIRIYEQR